nr:MAG TPA: hypothetical protein [Caudoviricetes sp.]
MYNDITAIFSNRLMHLLNCSSKISSIIIGTDRKVVRVFRLVVIYFDT